MKYRLLTGRFTAAMCAVGMSGLLVPSSPVAAQTVTVEQHSEAPAEQAPDSNVSEFNLAAGGTLSTGNTQSWQLNAGSSLRLVRGRHSTAAMVNFIYGQSDPPDDDRKGLEDTARNLNSKVRYDYFLTDLDALFAAFGHRWDTFAGLDTRVQIQAGYLRTFVGEKGLRLWGELGYDLTYDNYTDEVVAGTPDTDEEDVVHSLRGFLGYDNKLTETLTWETGLEGLMNVEDPVDFRVNWDTALRSKINGSLQLELKFALKYDNVPVPGTRNLDTLTQVNLIYALL